MYEKILLLMDCSPVDQRIVDHVVDLAAVHGSRVHLFHVLHAHTLDQLRTMQAESTACLDAAVGRFAERGVSADYSMVQGEPNEQVLKKIEECGCDLVALATHGHGGFADFILGSVSRAVKHQATKPILLLRGER